MESRIKQPNTLRNVPFKILKNPFERPGYNFLGWNVDPNAKFAQYPDGGTFIPTLDNVVLYAIWEIKQYDILTAVSPSVGGTVSGAGTYDYGTKVTLEAIPTPIPEVPQVICDEQSSDDIICENEQHLDEQVICNPIRYSFVKWSDGNRDNPRTIVVTGDQTYCAEFIGESQDG